VLFGDFKANLAQAKPREEVPGWPTEMGMWGSVQHPRDWRVTDKGDWYTELADKSGTVQMKFHTLVTFDGSPSFDEMAAVIFAKATGTSEAMSLGTVSGQTLPFASQDDSGVCQVWCLRWMHPQAGTMFSTLSIVVLARPAVQMAGLKSTVTWTFTCCPEAKAVGIFKSTLGPMLKSFWFPKGGGEKDSDGDGVNDNRDADPFDPNVH